MALKAKMTDVKMFSGFLFLFSKYISVFENNTYLISSSSEIRTQRLTVKHRYFRWALLFIQSYLLVKQSTLSNILSVRSASFIFFYFHIVCFSFSILFTYSIYVYFICIRHPTSILIIFCCSMRFNFRS